MPEPTSQQLVPPPCTGGHAAWHCELDEQLPHLPPPLLLPVELLPLDDEEVDPLDEVDELEPPDDDVDDE